MAKNKRIKVVEHVCSECFFDILEGNTPDQVIKKMKHYKSMYKGRDIFFHISYDYYDDTKRLELKERRLETYAELKTRLGIESKRDERKKMDELAREEKEREEYERLKKKFG